MKTGAKFLVFTTLSAIVLSLVPNLSGCAKIADADVTAAQKYLLGLGEQIAAKVTLPITAATLTNFCDMTDPIIPGCLVATCNAAKTQAVISCQNTPTADPNQRVQAIDSPCGSGTLTGVGEELKVTVTQTGNSLYLKWDTNLDVWDKTETTSAVKTWLTMIISMTVTHNGTNYQFTPDCDAEFSANINMLDVPDCSKAIENMPLSCSGL